jgi:tetratricopeptide (TPR) repeat protein
MPDRSVLPRYLRAAALAAEADLLATVPQMTGRRYEIAAQLYEDAVNGDPHRHWAAEPSSIVPCPECALLAGPSYINGGRHWLRGGRVDAAEQVLRAAVAFAPLSPHAHANLGVTLALRAESARVADDVDAVGRLLAEARDEMQRAVDLRPDHEDYRGRLAEFTDGAADPGRWTFRLAPPGTPDDNTEGEDPT